jgi:activator of Hsp90 ATPase-like protein
MTWLTTATKGVETVVTVRFKPNGGSSQLHLTRAGFPDEQSRKRHADAWPKVLAHLDQRIN